MPHWLIILFVFLLGSCVGSFLNVLVWRLPRIEYKPGETFWQEMMRTVRELSHPPSHCPRCNNLLKWYDNIPIIGWLKLGGKCRFCRDPISPRYPIVETVTALLFVFYYVMFFMVGVGPCPPNAPFVIGSFPLRGPPMIWLWHWPIYLLYMFMIAGLLAASIIDFEQFIIPIVIPWVMAIVGIIVHAIIDKPNVPGALNANASVAALGLGGGIGLLISIILWHLEHLPTSFATGDPLLEVERDALQQEVEAARAKGEQVEDLPASYTPAQIRAEMRKEMLFLMAPMLLACIAWGMVNFVPAVGGPWGKATSYFWVTGLCGAIFGGLVGAFVVWLVRILGTLGFGRVAMGMGDVHLMFGVGAVIGAGSSTVAFFIAPFFGIILALYLIITGKRREIPYGPYLSMASAFVILFSCPILAWLTPGMLGLRQLILERIGI